MGKTRSHAAQFRDIGHPRNDLQCNHEQCRVNSSERGLIDSCTLTILQGLPATQPTGGNHLHQGMHYYRGQGIVWGLFRWENFVGEFRPPWESPSSNTCATLPTPPKFRQGEISPPSLKTKFSDEILPPQSPPPPPRYLLGLTHPAIQRHISAHIGRSVWGGEASFETGHVLPVQGSIAPGAAEGQKGGSVSSRQRTPVRPKGGGPFEFQTPTGCKTFGDLEGGGGVGRSAGQPAGSPWGGWGGFNGYPNIHTSN